MRGLVSTILRGLPLVLGLSFMVCLPALADVPSASTGKAISGMCAGCHGSKGKATNTQYPNLAGQNYQYLLEQLKNFKSGQRSNPIMHGMTSGLSKTQMKDLAAYYSELKPR